MNTTALIRPPAAPGRAAPRSDAGDNASPAASERRTFGEMFGELIPLIGAVAGYGPPVIFLAGPWLLLGLMLSGPFAFLVILVVFHGRGGDGRRRAQRRDSRRAVPARPPPA